MSDDRRRVTVLDVEYGILGPLELRKNGVEVQLAPGHQRALLALLVLRRNQVVSMGRILTALWDDEPPQTAHKVVQNAVSHLRKTLGANLATHPPGYELRVEEGELDLDRFTTLVDRAQGEEPARAAQTLRDALSLWRGPPLTDFAYDQFAQSAIAELNELRVGALEDRIDADLALGGDAKLVPELETLVAEHPLRERLRGQLMLALYRGGRQNEALETYAEGRKRLVDELGLEPGPELRGLEKQILQHDPALGPAARSIPAPATVARRRRKVIGAVCVLVLAAASVSFVSYHDLGADPPAPISVAGDNVAVVDPSANRVVAAVSVGARPGRVATGQGAIWVVNDNDQTISRIDVETHATRTFSTASPAVDLAAGPGGVWVAGGPAGTVTRIEPDRPTAQQTISLPLARAAGRAFAFSIDASRRSVWVSGGSFRGGPGRECSTTQTGSFGGSIQPVPTSFRRPRSAPVRDSWRWAGGRPGLWVSMVSVVSTGEMAHRRGRCGCSR